jgi:hypothetical protein
MDKDTGPSDLEEVSIWNAAVEACAQKATGFLVGDPLNGIPLKSPNPHQIAEALLRLRKEATDAQG